SLCVGVSGMGSRVRLLASVSASMLLSAPAAWAADAHFIATNDTFMNYAPYGGFDVSLPSSSESRAIYDRAGTAQSMMGNNRNIGQLVFRAPYTGTGFATHST